MGQTSEIWHQMQQNSNQTIIFKYRHWKRLHWVQKNFNRDWNNVILTDESTFVLFNYLKRIWIRTGQTFIQRSVMHPHKVHIYECFFALPGVLMCFTKNLNAVMIKLYKKDLLQSDQILCDKNIHDWKYPMLQKENNACKKTISVGIRIETNKVKCSRCDELRYYWFDVRNRNCVGFGCHRNEFNLFCYQKQSKKIVVDRFEM